MPTNRKLNQAFPSIVDVIETPASDLHPGGPTRQPGSWLSLLGIVTCLAAVSWMFALGAARINDKRQPIETIRVGQRVLADNPEVDSPEATAVDPATWRHLTLRAEMTWENGHRDVVNVETLQSPEWVREHDTAAGASVPLPLDLVEMGLPRGLRAVVIDDRHCPPIASHGRGRVVLTTVRHDNPLVRELIISNPRGEEEKVRVTAYHKLLRLPDCKWVSVIDLKQGQQLAGRTGTLTVVANQQVTGVHAVNNMTVEGEHAYFVSTLELLAHNNNCTRVSGRNPPISPRQQLHINGTAGKSRFNPDLDVEAVVRTAWEGGTLVFDQNGKVIGKRFTFSSPVGTSPSGHAQNSNHGIHGVPTTVPQ